MRSIRIWGVLALVGITGVLFATYAYASFAWQLTDSSEEVIATGTIEQDTSQEPATSYKMALQPGECVKIKNNSGADKRIRIRPSGGGCCAWISPDTFGDGERKKICNDIDSSVAVDIDLIAP